MRTDDGSKIRGAFNWINPRFPVLSSHCFSHTRTLHSSRSTWLEQHKSHGERGWRKPQRLGRGLRLRSSVRRSGRTPVCKAPSHATDDEEMDMEEEVEFDPPEHGTTTVCWSGNPNLSVQANLDDSVESAMRKLAELHGVKIAEGKDSLRYELLGKERYDPTFNDVVDMWYSEGDVNGWEALNIVVHFKTMPMTAVEAKESEFRGVLAGAHVGDRTTRDRGTSDPRIFKHD